MVTDKTGREVRVGDILTYQGGYNYHSGENAWYHIGGRVMVLEVQPKVGRAWGHEDLKVSRLDEIDLHLQADTTSYVEARYFTKEDTTMVKDTHGVELQQHDIVRFVRDYNLSSILDNRAPAGTYGVVNYVGNYSFSVALARSGNSVSPAASAVEKVPGRWVPAAETRDLPASPVLLRLRNDVRANGLGEQERFLKGGVHLLVRTVGEHPFRDFRIKADHVRYQFSAANFEVFLPEVPATAPNPRAQAMTFDTARGYATQFKELGVRTRVRQRSWDEEARYAALEELDPAGTVVRKLYRAIDCHERLQGLRDLAVPIDVVGVPKGTYFQFTDGSGVVIDTPDKSSTWSLPEIKDTKGIAWHDGRKYRLCVRRVVPIYDEATGEATAS
jgi:hypothetical protein